MKRSGFERWPESLCCVLAQYTLLSQRLFPSRGMLMGAGELYASGEGEGGVMGWALPPSPLHPGRVEMRLVSRFVLWKPAAGISPS